MSSRPTAPVKRARRRGKGRRSAGFVLLEVLVAVAIAGVLMAVLLRAFSNTWSGIAVVREEAEGTLMARSILDEVLMRNTLSPGSQEGTLGRYAWTIATTLQTVSTVVAANEENKPTTASIFHVVVTMRGPSGRSNRLDAYKIGTPAAQ